MDAIKAIPLGKMDLEPARPKEIFMPADSHYCLNCTLNECVYDDDATEPVSACPAEQPAQRPRVEIVEVELKQKPERGKGKYKKNIPEGYLSSREFGRKYGLSHHSVNLKLWGRQELVPGLKRGPGRTWWIPDEPEIARFILKLKPRRRSQ